MASWSALAAVVLSSTTPLTLVGGASLPPALTAAADGRLAALPASSGNRLRINGLDQSAAWRWLGPAGAAPSELWLPLEVLQGQLGISSRSNSDGSLELEWYGRRLQVPASGQRALGDEVAVEVAALLAEIGVQPRLQGERLLLDLPAAALQRVRVTDQPGRRRVVLDLQAPATLRSSEGELLLSVTANLDPGGLQQLAAAGLRATPQASGLALRATASAPLRVFTLGDPARIVIDLPPAGGGSAADSGSATFDPRLQSLLGQQLQWDRQERWIDGRRVRINAVRLDPRRSPLELRPLSRSSGMEGLSSLSQLARERDALVAINGGFFNRVRRLPLGALRDQGRWLSGPILNRGVVAWEPRDLPRFGRLQLDEWLQDGDGRRWPLTALNSGWVQRGLSRYTADWGPSYRALSGGESGVLVAGGVVRERLDPDRLSAGIRLDPDTTLLVGRGGVEPPWREGERLQLVSLPSSPLGNATHVVGGGPLLLLDGRAVLNGGAEGFSAAFLSQGAPRTVIGSDGQQLWLVTLQGISDDGPTLAETAILLQRMGLRDALNLDGGSSTGLVMGGNHTVKGRGVAGSVHHGLGLVPAGGGSRGFAPGT